MKARSRKGRKLSGERQEMEWGGSRKIFHEERTGEEHFFCTGPRLLGFQQHSMRSGYNEIHYTSLQLFERYQSSPFSHRILRKRGHNPPPRANIFPTDPKITHYFYNRRYHSNGTTKTLFQEETRDCMPLQHIVWLLAGTTPKRLQAFTSNPPSAPQMTSAESSAAARPSAPTERTDRAQRRWPPPSLQRTSFSFSAPIPNLPRNPRRLLHHTRPKVHGRK